VEHFERAPEAGPVVLRAKLTPPRQRAAAAPRARLLERADDPELRLVVVAAPAGFGKSTLLAHLAARGERRVAWLSLDERDEAGPRFWRHLVEGLRDTVPAFAERAATALTSPRPPSSEELAAELVNALATADEGVLVVLDDYHVIQNPDLHAGVAFVIERLPPGSTVAIGSRTAPPLPLARLRARGELLELGADDLRANVDEAAAFLVDGMGLALDTDAVERLWRRTEGWFAGLQLAALALRGRERDADALDAFGADHRLVLDYLSEEVLAGLEPSLQTFLLESSVLERLSAAACDAVLERDDGASMLRLVEESNLFVVALDASGTVFRYHALFRDWLRRRLAAADDARVRVLEARAATWCIEQGDTEGAIPHLLATGDVESAARLVADAADGALRAGRVVELRAWLGALPREVVRSRAQLALASAWCELVAGDPRAIVTWTDTADDAADLTAAGRAEVAALRSYVASIRGDVASATRLAEDALAALTHDTPWVRGILLQGLGAARYQGADLNGAGEAFDLAANAFEAAGSRYGWLHSMLGVADTRRPQGALRAAERAYRAMLMEDRVRVPMLGHASIGLGKIAIERFALEEAQALVEDGIAIGGGLERGVHIDGMMTLAFVHRLRSAWAEADAALRDARREAARYGFDRAVRRIATFRAALSLAAGDVEDARRWRAGGGAPSSEAPRQGDHYEHVTLARLSLGEGDAEAAGRRIDACLVEARRRGLVGNVIELLVLRSRAASSAGRRETAEATLDEALELAAVEGYVRPFLHDDEALLPALAARARRARGLGDAHAERVVAAAGGLVADPAPDTPAPASGVSGFEPLTDRERTVLRLLAAGNANKAIARALDLSVNTVKTHVRTVYGKLGVRSRAELIVRVRDEGLLP
jgi:LuxR family transcriptional regulator, maltose regulon positive regulatory protein